MRTLSAYVRTLCRSQAEAAYLFTQAVAPIFGTLPSEGQMRYSMNYSNEDRSINFNKPFHYSLTIVPFLTTAQKEG